MTSEIEWRVEPGRIDYGVALAEMEARAAAVTRGDARELVWLLEHPPVYTAGTSATDAAELLDPRFPVHKTGRGGRYTYHGPGQRIGYVVLDLREVTFIDSAGVRLVLEGSRALAAAGGELVVVRGGHEVQRLFALVGLDGRVRIVDRPPGE